MKAENREVKYKEFFFRIAKNMLLRKGLDLRREWMDRPGTVISMLFSKTHIKHWVEMCWVYNKASVETAAVQA